MATYGNYRTDETFPLPHIRNYLKFGLVVYYIISVKKNGLLAGSAAHIVA